MKVAIVGFSPAPFVRGGMETLLDTLNSVINERTIHEAELIKLPCPERDFWELIDCYEQFYKLDLDHFDQVICNKYPTWMVQHRNKVIYQGHPLRSFYDLHQPQPRMADALSEISEVGALLKAVQDPTGEGEESIQRVFDCCDRLRSVASHLPELLFEVTGDLSRIVARFLDRIGIQGARKFFAVSRTVAQREGYFPVGAAVTVLPHPPSRLRGRPGPYQYFFTASRLERLKRIDLLVGAMKYVPHDIPLLIAGSGIEEPKLRRLAKSDSRIRFLGRVSDEEIAKLYSGALAVPFVPYDEDMGLITFEAMMAEKPVITTLDSGGPTEFVRDGHNGYVVEPRAQPLGEAMARLAADPALARKLGRNGALSVANITWDHTLSTLLGEPVGTLSPPRRTVIRSAGKRKKLVVASTFAASPPMGGGQVRLFNLYRALARIHDVEIVSLIPHGARSRRAETAPGLTEIHVPLSNAQEKWTRELQDSVPGAPDVGDIAATLATHLTPDFVEALAQATRGASATIASHPYLFSFLRSAAPDLPLVYEAHNVEADLKAAMYPRSEPCLALVSRIKDVESEAVSRATLVATTTEPDGARLEQLFGRLASRGVVVSNGVDCDQTPFLSWQIRRRRREISALAANPVALFLGSSHLPNLRCAEMILEMALELPEVVFLIAGSVGLPFMDRKLPSNVVCTGVVDESTRRYLLQRADFSLNPADIGSGSSLKLFDSLASGCPFITTSLGARGIAPENQDTLIIAELPDFSACLRGLRDEDLERVSRRGRSLVESHHDWRLIAFRYGGRLQEILE